MAGKKVKCPIMNQDYTLNSINFYSDSRNNNGFSAISKEGIFKIINDSKDEKEGFRKSCEKLNRPFILDVYNYCKDKKSEASSKDLFIYYYAKNILLNQNYKDLDYSQSVFESICDDGLPKKDNIDEYLENKKVEDAKRLIEKKKEENKKVLKAIQGDKLEPSKNKKKEIISFDYESDFEVTPAMVKIWGKGYDREDYEYLEDSYKEWTTRYKCDTLAEEKTYRFLSLKELEIRKTREQNGNVDKLEETFRKLMSDANVTPRDANAANDPENMNTLGMWIKDIERYRPAEYFEDKKLYFDFDGIKEYLDRFVFRPLKNLLTGSRDFDKEFNVEVTDEVEEYVEPIEENKDGDI